MVAREMHDAGVSHGGERDLHSQRAPDRIGPEGARHVDPGDVQVGSSTSPLGRRDPLRLQRLIGNTAVSRALSRPRAQSLTVLSPPIQTKLVVGPANDPYEREADRVAERVTSQVSSGSAPPIQRIIAEDEDELLQGKFLVRRQLEEEEELQMKSQAARGGAGFTADGDIARRLEQLRGSGSGLPADFRSDIETKLGADFGHVRIHTGSEVDALNRSLGARAFTTGSDIFFAQGQYDPLPGSGKRLLAHELTHVVQQTGNRVNGPAAQSPTGGEAAAQPVSHTGAQPAIQRKNIWEEMGLTEDEWRERFQNKRKEIRQKLAGERELLEREQDQDQDQELDQELDQDQDQSGETQLTDEEYIRQQQEKYRPSPEQLEKLLRGAEMIRQKEQAPTDQTKKPSRWGKVKGFFSRFRRNKSESIPKPPKAPTDEELRDVQQQRKRETEQSLGQRLKKPKSLAEQLQEERRNRGMLPVSQPDSVGTGRAPEKMSRWGKVKSFFSGLGKGKTAPEETPKKQVGDVTGGLKRRGYDPMEQTPAPQPKLLSTTVSEPEPKKTDGMGGMTGMGALMGGLLGGLLSQRGGGGGSSQGGLSDLPQTVKGLVDRLDALEEKVKALSG